MQSCVLYIMTQLVKVLSGHSIFNMRHMLTLCHCASHGNGVICNWRHWGKSTLHSLKELWAHQLYRGQRAREALRQWTSLLGDVSIDVSKLWTSWSSRCAQIWTDSVLNEQCDTCLINYYSDRWLTGRLFFSMALFILTFRALDLGFHGHFFQLSNSFVNAIYRLFPYISSSVYCLLVAVCYDQILIEVTSRAKSPNISIFNV